MRCQKGGSAQLGVSLDKGGWNVWGASGLRKLKGRALYPLERDGEGCARKTAALKHDLLVDSKCCQVSACRRALL